MKCGQIVVTARVLQTGRNTPYNLAMVMVVALVLGYHGSYEQQTTVQFHADHRHEDKEKRDSRW